MVQALAGVVNEAKAAAKSGRRVRKRRVPPSQVTALTGTDI
jgi:hypothetical protein